MRPQPIPPGPGQESVWDYPRPPGIELSHRHVRLTFAGQLLADTRRALRVLETSHPPTWYLPPEDVNLDLLRPNDHTSFCEFKGTASYYDLASGQHLYRAAAWSYTAPSGRFAPLAGHLAFYAQALEECTVDGEQVLPQPGGFYGGWITSDVVGPFKGTPGSWGW